MIGKIQRVKLREVWKHEAHDFTTWLEQNIDVLNDVIDLELMSAEREKSAGAFSVDLVAEDNQGDPVVIENQLEKSNHDHLGKLVTYVAAIGAKAAIWIVSDPRPEHVTAIAWLNESNAVAFYLLKVEAIQIGESQPAPLLTLIVGPSEEAREAGETKKEMAERHILRKRFWSSLLGLAREKTKLHAAISPSSYNWITTGAGVRGLAYNYVVVQRGASVELYIDRGKDAKEENKAIFDSLFEHRNEVEQAFGGPLEWERLDAKRACRIVRRFENGGYRDDEEKWKDIHLRLINAMICLEKALRPYVAKLKVGA
jgi:hypothetical protein